MSISDKFREYFEMFPATNDALLREVYKLRYQVYCVETGFEKQEDCEFILDEENREIGLESDEFDARSVHYLVRHKASRTYAATVRLVLPDPHNRNAVFPIESHCQLDYAIKDPELRIQIAEISRLAVSKNFKRRRGEAGTTTGITDHLRISLDSEERRVLPHITVGLFNGIVRMAREQGITHWYAVMEPALLRFLQRFGINFNSIGPTTDYHGIRRPCFGKVDDILPSIKDTNKEIWDLITDNGNLA